jgi:hypothetical protein
MTEEDAGLPQGNDGAPVPSTPPAWRTARRVARVAIVLAVIVFFVVLIFKNVAPFGATVRYDINLGDRGRALPSPLTPSTALGRDGDGSIYEVSEVKMTTDTVTFELKVPYESFDSAEIAIAYRGDPPELLFGMAGNAEDPYLPKPVHNRSLNNLQWDRQEDGPLTLYQKKGDYGSVGEFIAEPPLPAPGEPDYARVAQYYYEIAQPLPQVDRSRIDAGSTVASALLGPHTFCLYVGQQPLQVSLTKVELNRSEGSDPLDVIIYRGTEPVWATSVPDDGDEGEGGVLAAPREVDFTVEGLAEGVYSVDLVCGEDVVIENISSAQGYMSFLDEVYLADEELYDLGPPRPATVFTDARELSVYTSDEESFQTITADGEVSLDLDRAGRKALLSLPPGINEVRTEKGGVALMSAESVFSFSRESFFVPFPLKVVPYGEIVLLTDIEYIIADYTVPAADGDWRTRTLYFDLRGMKIEDDVLRCALFCPGLQQRGGEIVLGDISIELKKGD